MCVILAYMGVFILKATTYITKIKKASKSILMRSSTYIVFGLFLRVFYGDFL